ncbi:acyl carrier protein [Streptomyces sp. NPDC056796]|uniref:acyl carrier protein n=1 Tax=Streptomyces sp. NPDC056796 TaxID=3345947 RepID=UPI00367CEC4C
MLSRSEVEAVAVEAITEILREDGETSPRISGDATLVDLGVSSLVFARVAIELEDELGVDPFKEGPGGEAARRTVDDLVDTYVQALAEQGAR